MAISSKESENIQIQPNQFKKLSQDELNGSLYFSKHENFLFNDSGCFECNNEEIYEAVSTIFNGIASNQQIKQLSNSLSQILYKSTNEPSEEFDNDPYFCYPPNMNQEPRINLILFPQQSPSFPIPPFAIPYTRIMPNQSQPPMIPYTYPPNAIQIPRPYQPTMMLNPYLQNSFMQNTYNPVIMSGPYANMIPMQQQPSSDNKDKKKKIDKKSKKDKKSNKDKKKHEKSKKDKKKITKCENGIFQYLYSQSSASPIDKGIVEIKSNQYGGVGGDISLLLQVINPNSTSKHWTSTNTENSSIIINFKKILVKVNKYHLKLGFKDGQYVFKSWIIKGTTEDGQTVVLDEVNETDRISRSNPESTFEINNKYKDSFLHSICLTMRGRNGLNYQMAIRGIELYGSIKSLE